MENLSTRMRLEPSDLECDVVKCESLMMASPPHSSLTMYAVSYLESPEETSWEIYVSMLLNLFLGEIILVPLFFPCIIGYLDNG